MREITTTHHDPPFSHHRLSTLNRPATAEDVSIACIGIVLLASGILGLCAPILKLSISKTAVLSGNILCVGIGVILITLGALRYHQTKKKGTPHE